MNIPPHVLNLDLSYSLFELAPSMSVNFISLVTSCVDFGRRTHKEPISCHLHGHLLEPLVCSRDI